MNNSIEVIVSIVAIIGLCVVVCFVPPDSVAKEVITPCITGIFGIVTGRALSQKKGE